MAIFFLILIILSCVIIGFFILVQNPKEVDLRAISQASAHSSWRKNKQLMYLRKAPGCWLCSSLY
jgi:preprotein translocase subunit SecG